VTNYEFEDAAAYMTLQLARSAAVGILTVRCDLPGADERHGIRRELAP
jgi:hypothetical protein